MFLRVLLLAALLLPPSASADRPKPDFFLGQFSCTGLLIGVTALGIFLAGYREVNLANQRQNEAFWGNIFALGLDPHDFLSRDEEFRTRLLHYRAIGLLETSGAFQILQAHRNDPKYEQSIQALELPSSKTEFLKRTGNEFAPKDPDPYPDLDYDTAPRWRTDYPNVGWNRRIIAYRAQVTAVLETILTDIVDERIAAGDTNVPLDALIKKAETPFPP